MDLNMVWFGLVGVLLTGYALLDGFDLGVGVLSLFSRKEMERRVAMHSIAPVWDGNEVWLLAGGGALFAAFPVVYATVFSGFYLALMLLLAALIFRAISLEFYAKLDSDAWRTVFAWGFGIGSLLPPVLLGVALGNILRGVPIGPDGNFAGTFIGLLNPYSVLVGVLTLAAFVMHGALYLALKSDGELRDRMRAWARKTYVAVVALYAAATVATVFVSPHLFQGLLGKPVFLGSIVLLAAGFGLLPRALGAGKDLQAFIASCCIIAGMTTVAGISLFPRLVPNSLDMAASLTAYNASSTPRTLGVMLLVALLGVPPMLLYTAYVYWVFKGKAEPEGY